ncbi:hypothetical protein ALC60_05421, partial [Trachymyrmex zeteki]
FLNVILDSPHGKPSSGKCGWWWWLSSMSPVDGLTPEGLHRLRHSPERLLTGLRDYAAVPNAIVEIAHATATAATTMEAVPSPHWAPVSAVIAAIMATWTAKLTGMLVHPLTDLFAGTH